jgi:hypothetical protein
MSSAPERIYNWLDSQTSIARHYGGLRLNGHDYQIAYDEAGKPLVRADVLAREAKERRKAANLARAQARAGQTELKV